MIFLEGEGGTGIYPFKTSPVEICPPPIPPFGPLLCEEVNIKQSMSATSVERVSSQKHFAELQLTGIEPATLVTGPSNSTTEVRP